MRLHTGLLGLGSRASRTRPPRRTVLVIGAVVSFVSTGCGGTDDARSTTAYCAAEAAISATTRSSAALDPMSASAAEVTAYFGQLRDAHAALARAAPEAIRPDAEILAKALDDVVRELARLGSSSSSPFADPDGRRMLEILNADRTLAAAERVRRFTDENCTADSDDEGVTVTGPNRSSGFTGAAPSSGDPRVPLIACLRAQGLDVPDPAPAGGTARPVAAYPPDAATRAWQSCRSIYESSIGGVARADTLAFVDCMATQGWLQAVMSGPPADLAAHNAAGARCRAQSPSMQAVVTCLRTQGLDVIDPSSAAGASPAPQRFEPAAASAAWTVCREVYRTASGIPDTLVSQVLRVPDCMASRGWIIVIMTGELVAGAGFDKADYDTARAACG